VAYTICGDFQLGGVRWHIIDLRSGGIKNVSVARVISVFLAKSASPCKELPFCSSDAIERAAERSFTFFVAPAGYLLPGYLSAVLVRQERPIFWLRLGPEDRDPANFLISLIDASQCIDLHIGADTINRMQRYPGCIHGWSPLFESFSEELSETLQGSWAVVLENIHQLGQATSVLRLAVSHFLDRLPENFSRIVASHKEFPAGMVANPDNVIGINALRITSYYRSYLEGTPRTKLPEDYFNRLVHLSNGRIEVLSGVFAACELLDDQYVRNVLYRARTQDQLLTQIGQTCLQMADPEELLALAFTLTLGYFHSKIFEEIFGKTILPDGPWLQPLSNKWYRIRDVWQPALRKILHHYIAAQRESLFQAAELLSRLDAVEIAVPLFLRIGAYKQGARTIERNVERLMNLGQWGSLMDWLSQIPSEVSLEFPKLVYTQGELHAFYGHKEEARSSFIQAGRAFARRGDLSNTCKSLLSEGVLASRDGDEQRALLSVQDAHAVSESSSLRQERAWTNWQLGILASTAEKPGIAKIRFKEACQLTNDPYSRDMFQRALTFAQGLENAGLQEEYHEREAQLAEKTGQEMSRHLFNLFELPPDNLPELLKLYGWLGVPLALKLPNQASEKQEALLSPSRNIWNRLRKRLGEILPVETDGHITSLSPLDLVVLVQSGQYGFDHTVSVNLSPDLAGLEHQPVEKAPNPVAQIMIYCLGALRVLNKSQFVSNWPSHKAQLVFKYLLLHYNTLVHKETIMETFWPDADVEAARRNLHQAIYNLRLTLKGIDDDLHIIEFEQDGYRFNPTINMWIDYVVFEQRYSAAHQKDVTGLTDQAMSEYAMAEEMYMDHLFSEDPYEDWMRSQREYLWQIYLSTATRLAEYHFQKKNFSSALSIGQRILQKDPCEETAHQILMRCFHNQGQRQLAIRQYEICRQALRDELDVEPSARVKELFNRLLKE